MIIKIKIPNLMKLVPRRFRPDRHIVDFRVTNADIQEAKSSYSNPVLMSLRRGFNKYFGQNCDVWVTNRCEYINSSVVIAKFWFGNRKVDNTFQTTPGIREFYEQLNKWAGSGYLSNGLRPKPIRFTIDFENKRIWDGV